MDLRRRIFKLGMTCGSTCTRFCIGGSSGRGESMPCGEKGTLNRDLSSFLSMDDWFAPAY